MIPSESFIFTLLFFMQQIANEAAPLSIEIIHHKEGPVKVVKSKIEIDDNLIQDLFAEEQIKNEATKTDRIPDYPEYQADVDYGAYEYDCAVPLMPDIVGYEIQEKDMTDLTTPTPDYQNRQVRDTPRPSLLESTIANINGIALNVMSLFFDSVGAVVPNRIISNS